MVEEDLIRERLRLLEEYISDLEDVRGSSWEEFQGNKVLRRFVERTVQIAIVSLPRSSGHPI